MDIELVCPTGPESDKALLLPFGQHPRNEEEGKYCYTLLNIPGQRYTIGSAYPGDERGDGEFLYYGSLHKKSKDPSNICSLSVDEEGQFWISNYVPPKTKKTPRSLRVSTWAVFVNRGKVEAGGKALIQIGDSLTFENAVEGGCFTDCLPLCPVLSAPCPPSFTVQKRKNKIKRKPRKTESEGYNTIRWENSLVLFKIFSHLSFTDLQSCRLVSTLWESEACPLLEPLSKISFNFVTKYTYFHPSLSLLTFHYLHEASNLFHPQTLELRIPSTEEPITRKFRPSSGGKQKPVRVKIERGSSAEKMFHDLKKLVKYRENNFSSLQLIFNLKSRLDMSVFKLLLNLPLVELNFLGDFDIKVIQKSQPLITHQSLRKFTHKFPTQRKHSDQEIEKWGALFSSFLTNVETICLESEEIFPSYFPDNPENFKLKNLKEIYLQYVFFPKLGNLLAVKNGLTVLDIVEIKDDWWSRGNFDEYSRNLSLILAFHSETLEKLKLELPYHYDIWTLIFPEKFSKLREFCLFYNHKVSVKWEENGTVSLDYSKVFPVLRSLKILKGKWGNNLEDENKEGLVKLVFDQGNHFDLDFFHAFFPDTLFPVDSFCLTVREFADPTEYIYKCESATEEDTEKAWRKLKNIADIFPNVRSKKWEEIRESQSKEMVWGNK